MQPQKIVGFREISISALVPSPLEPAERLKPDAGLVDSIRTLGLLQPVCVAPIRGQKGTWMICAGHRRFAAAQALGWPAVPCAVLTMEVDLEGQAPLDLLLAENIARKDFDSIEEADLVAKLLKRPNATQKMVAEAVGRSIAWVARRANLATLSSAAREARGDQGILEDWQVTWLEELAILAPHQQDAVLEFLDQHPHARPLSLEHVQQLLGDHLRTLRHAPWDLADAELVPAVGACTRCPKTSCAEPTLFGLEPGDLDPKTATCRDARCFDAKRAAFLALRLVEARAEHGKDVLIVRSEPGFVAAEGEAQPAGLAPHRWEKCPKTKGGVPAVVLDGPNAGTVTHVRERTEREIHGGDAPRPKVDPEKQVVGAVVRRLRNVLGEAGERMFGGRSPGTQAHHLLDLFLWAREMRNRGGSRKFVERPIEQLVAEARELVVQQLDQVVQIQKFAKDVDEARGLLKGVIDLTGFEWGAAVEQARAKFGAEKVRKKRRGMVRRAARAAL